MILSRLPTTHGADMSDYPLAHHDVPPAKLDSLEPVQSLSNNNEQGLTVAMTEFKHSNSNNGNGSGSNSTNQLHHKGGMTFPAKLYQLLEDGDVNDSTGQVVSWLPDGTGFKIHKPSEFIYHLLNRYFKTQTKLKSFTRQLYAYGFSKVHLGPNQGAFCHPLLVDGNKEAILNIRRNTINRDRRFKIGSLDAPPSPTKATSPKEEEIMKRVRSSGSCSSASTSPILASRGAATTHTPVSGYADSGSAPPTVATMASSGARRRTGAPPPLLNFYSSGTMMIPRTKGLVDEKNTEFPLNAHPALSSPSFLKTTSNTEHLFMSPPFYRGDHFADSSSTTNAAALLDGGAGPVVTAHWFAPAGAPPEEEISYSSTNEQHRMMIAGSGNQQQHQGAATTSIHNNNMFVGEHAGAGAAASSSNSSQKTTDHQQDDELGDFLFEPRSIEEMKYRPLKY